MALGSDPSAIVGARVQKGLIRRVWRFARAYRPMLAGFLATIVLAAIIDIVPPFLIRRIMDEIHYTYRKGFENDLVLIRFLD